MRELRGEKGRRCLHCKVRQGKVMCDGNMAWGETRERQAGHGPTSGNHKIP